VIFSPHPESFLSNPVTLQQKSVLGLSSVTEWIVGKPETMRSLAQNRHITH